MAQSGGHERVSSAAVQAATGKTWPQWFRILDAAGCKTRTHKDVVAYLHENYGKLNGWWCQMVTVAYEQERGLRDKHEKPDGYQVSGSKTIAVPVSRLFKAFKDGPTRHRWLPGQKITIRKATPNKSMRITWTDGNTGVNANFYARGPQKAQVAVNHGKLPDAEAAEKARVFWRERLTELKSLLEDE